MKVLIVDDEDSAREYLEKYLKIKGMEVCGVKEGEVVQPVVEEFQPDIILLDIKLGSNMTGFDVLDILKETHPHIKIIMITGYTEENVAEEIMSRGAAGYLFKPINFNEVEKLILSHE